MGCLVIARNQPLSREISSSMMDVASLEEKLSLELVFGCTESSVSEGWSLVGDSVGFTSTEQLTRIKADMDSAIG
jgi:hypothetical protein